jgi:hypothetical protein
VLVLRRDEGSWTNLEISAARLKELAEHGEAVRLRFRVYDIRDYYDERKQKWVRKVNLAFEDPEENFDIQRPERRSTPLLKDKSLDKENSSARQ